MFKEFIFLTSLILTCQTPIFAVTKQYEFIKKVDSFVTLEKENLLSIYKSLHQNPELPLKEVETSKFLETKLKELKFETINNIGGTGIVGILKNGEGPTYMVRTDMDALPVEEKTGLPFKSTKTMIDPETNKEAPAMHACGHDVHMTIFLGLAKLMSESKEMWKGTLVLIGQPAEERLLGAKAMIKDGLYKKAPKPDAIIGLHVHPYLKAGTVGYREGAIMAASNGINIMVRGIGGHGAIPQNTKDPIVLSAKIIDALQSIISREVPPSEMAVITVGRIQGGLKRNVIPDKVEMNLTIRSYNEKIQEYLLKAIERVAINQAKSMGFPDHLLPIIEVVPSATLPVINGEKLTKKMVASFNEILGKENVLLIEPLTASEDFAYYGNTKEKIPTHFFFIGAIKPKDFSGSKKPTDFPSIHSDSFAPDAENAIPTGIKAFSMALFNLFNEKEGK